MNKALISKLPEMSFACRESLNTLATNLSYCGDDVHTVMVTSRYAGEGKSFISLNLMRTLASLQKRVVLLDTDLRRSRMVSNYRIRFQTENPNGLAQYLAGRCTLEDIIYHTNVENGYLIPIGREVESSLQLLSSSRMPKLMAALSEQFDMVIVDTPPAGVIVDALVIAKYCSGSLIVVSAGRGTKRDVAELVSTIRNTGCRVLGSVLNNVNFGSYTNRKYYYKSERYSSYYRGGYYNPYSSQSGKKGK